VTQTATYSLSSCYTVVTAKFYSTWLCLVANKQKVILIFIRTRFRAPNNKTDNQLTNRWKEVQPVLVPRIVSLILGQCWLVQR